MGVETGPELLPHRQDFVQKQSKPLNPLGEWLHEYKSIRGLSYADVDKWLSIASSSQLSHTPSESVSLWSIEQFLRGFSRFELTPDEQSSLSDSIAQVIDARMESRGEIPYRIPPAVAIKQAKESLSGEYTDTILARELLGEDVSRKAVGRVRRARLSLELPMIYGQDDARVIIELLKDAPFHLDDDFEFSNMLASYGVSPDLFAKKGWYKRKRLPNPEEFGEVLQVAAINEEALMKVVSYWEGEFREHISPMGAEMRNELKKKQKQSLFNLKKAIDPEGKMSNWEVIEAMRQREETPFKEKLKLSAGRVRMVDLAEEYHMHLSYIYKIAKKLGVEETAHLTEEDVIRIRQELVNHPGKIIQKSA